MVAIRISGPTGRVPRIHRNFLKSNQAQIAIDVRLHTGEAQPIRAPYLVHTVSGYSGNAFKSIFRLQYLGTDKWLTWDRDVDVARSQVTGDALGRIYWTGEYEPRMSHLAQLFGFGGTQFPLHSNKFVLGVVAPTGAPTVGTVNGASGVAETRTYVYTYVTELGEESAPSPPTTATVTQNVGATWTLTPPGAGGQNVIGCSAASWSGGLARYTVAFPNDLRVNEELDVFGFTPAGYNVRGPIVSIDPVGGYVYIAIASNPGTATVLGSLQRIALHNNTNLIRRFYRTIVAASGETEYRFVLDIPVATSFLNDTVSNATVALASLLESEDYAMPPSDGFGLVAMPNGIFAMASKNEVYFSEPFKPHAWPTKYRQAVKGASKIVGLGVIGTTLVIGTDGSPNYITGVEPGTMGGGAQAVDEAWPCLSKRGIVSAAAGVFYPTRIGMALIGPGGATIATRALYTEEEWRALGPTSMIAAMRDNKLLVGYNTIGLASPLQLFSISLEEGGVIDHSHFIEELWTDPRTGQLFLCKNGSNGLIYEWESTSQTVKESGTWRSAEIVLPAPKQFGAIRVDCSMPNGADTLTVTIYSDGVPKYGKAVSNNRPFTLPKGYKIERLSIAVFGTASWRSLVIGGTVQELRNA